MADEYVYKDPNTDMMKALSKAVDAATGKTGTQYEYKNPDSDVIQKLEELIEAIATSGGGGSSHNYLTTEHTVGTWIDGSTIYEITIPSTTYFYTTATAIADLSTITYERILFLEVSAKINFAGQEPMIFNPSGSECYINQDKKVYAKQSLAVQQSGRTMETYITIRYTKSST